MSSAPAIEIATSREALARSCADLIAAELRAGIAQNGKASFVATGGSTPAECYKILATEDLDWTKVSVTLSDERWVDTFSAQSNEKMLRETLLVGAAAGAHFLGLKARRGGPDDGAKRAEAALHGLAPFDVVLLGMGEDGHIASLFPGHPAAAEGLKEDATRWCVGVAKGEPAPDVPRVSLTMPALTASRLILVLITGDTKWRVVNEAKAAPIAALFAQKKTPVRVLWAA